MNFVAYRGWSVTSLSLVSVLLVGLGTSPAQAVEMQNGGIEAGKFVLGMRAGFAPLTQSLTKESQISTSTSVGSLVNFQAMYSLNSWLLVGMMLEWERHGVDSDGTDLGHLDTVSVLPTIEIRPVKFGSLVPYANMSFGVNVNSFGESSDVRGAGIRVSPSNNFAWRLGWGADYMLTKQFALNAEMAYKRNDGHATLTQGPNSTTIDANASSFGFLFGVKMFF